MARNETVVLYPSVDSHDLGPQHIDLHLFAGNQGDTAHAVAAHLFLATPDGPLHTTLQHPANEGPLRLAPGLVQVQSNRGSTLSLYTFGAALTSVADAELSTARIESPAPVLWVGKSFFDNDMNPVDLVVDEFQAWLSVLRARSSAHLPAFYRNLQAVSPFVLYLQALILAARDLGEVPVDERSERYWRSHRTIHSALAAAQARPHAPQPLPNLEQLLLPSH